MGGEQMNMAEVGRLALKTFGTEFFGFSISKKKNKINKKGRKNTKNRTFAR
jgi:hypothetical protein